MIMSVPSFVRCEVSTAADDEPLRVKEPAVGTCVGFSRPLLNHRIHHQVSDSLFCLTRADKEESLIDERALDESQSRAQPGQRNGGCALDVIIEHAHLVAILIQHAKSSPIAETFKLDQGLWKHFLNSSHQLVNQIIVSGAADPALLGANIKWILKQVFVISASIDGQGQASRGMNSGACCIQ